MESSILDKLGIDWKLFIAQIVNFVILLYILRRYLYKPVLAMLDKRAKIVSTSLEEAKRAEIGVKEAEKMKEEMVSKARVESREIIDEAKEIGVKEREVILAKTREDNERLMKAGVKAVEQERESMKAELEKEVGKLLVFGLEKVTRKILTPADQKKIMEESIDSIRLS